MTQTQINPSGTALTALVTPFALVLGFLEPPKGFRINKILFNTYFFSPHLKGENVDTT